MNERLNALLRTEPSLGIAKRASFLVVASGPYHREVTKEVDRVPMANVALAGTISGLQAAMTALPQLAIERAVQRTLGGPPTTPAQVGAHRRALLAGNAAAMVAGILAQRAINHSGRSGPVAELGRIAASQLAIGAAAATIVTGSDAVLGPLLSRKDRNSAATIAVTAMTLRGQSRTLKRVAAAITMPTRPSRYAYVG